jgi:hypothetical protein
MSPSRVLPRQPHHQRADCRPDRWPATGRWSQPRVGPAPGDQLTMPAQQRSWADEPNIPKLPAQQTRQHRQHYPILGLQPRPCDLAAQHRNLMTQNEQLDVLRPLPSTAENDQCKQTQRKRVNHRQHHPAIIPQSGKVRRAEVLEPDRVQIRPSRWGHFCLTSSICAAECAHPVASNASKISMISLSDFFTVPPVRPARVVEDLERCPGGTLTPDRHDQSSCPRKGRSAVREEGDDVSAYRDLGLSAVTSRTLIAT